MSFRQTCKVRVTGRNMRYQRALQIVQDEEYLSAIDLDDIRRYRRKFQIKRRKLKKHVRKKRQESCKFMLIAFKLSEIFLQVLFTFSVRCVA